LVGSCPAGLGRGIEDYGGWLGQVINALLVKKGRWVAIDEGETCATGLKLLG